VALRAPSEHWDELKRLFQAALEAPPEKRARILEETARRAPDLASELHALLEAHRNEGSFLEEIVAAEGLELLDSAESRMAGRRVGPYEVVRPLGQGGMGAVFLARRADREYEHLVALKVVRAPVFTEEGLRRFRTERQMLANLSHPNIARLLDGGTTPEGVPWLAMEYVEGEPIDVYCRREALSIEARLKLFRTICSAVDHAHRNLVVHRDLKPSNILVTAGGEVKLLDFGIAKLLPGPEEEGATLTRAGERAMTPDYASPEQVRGGPITTATDVYSLGVLLYRLLTEHHPYRIDSERPSEVERVICEEVPPRPSTAVGRLATPATSVAGAGDLSHRSAAQRLSRRLRGDLDNIVLQALRKEPSRRYGSVAELSEDVRRYLEGLPVSARQDSLAYRTGKFLRRHRLGASATALVALALLGGLAATVWQARIASEHARIAEAERLRAARRFAEVRELAKSFLFEFHDAIEDLPGSTPARKLVVQRALQYLDRLSSEAEGDPSLALELAEAYRRVGNVQGNPNNANLGDSSAALESYRRALAIAEPLRLRREHPGASRAVALIHEKMGDVLAASGNLPGAVEATRRSLLLFRELAREAPEDLRAQRSLAISHVKMGDVAGNPDFPNAGDRAQAFDHYQRSATILERLGRNHPQDETVRRFLGLVHERIGTIRTARGELPDALASFRRSLAIREAFAADHADNTDARRDAAVAQEKLGDFHRAAGERLAALQSYRLALSVFEALEAADPENENASRSLAVGLEKVGEMLAALRKGGEARGVYARALTLREKLSAADPANEEARNDLAALRETLSRLGLRPKA
jgi:non-specific serine/threonine protein kinase/serine/threonine-protein kinase